MKKKVVIVHLYEGYPTYSWYPYAKRELTKLGFQVAVPQMPHPNHPKQSSWVKKLEQVLGKPDEYVSLIGHSIGAVTILRYLEGLRENEHIGSVVLVAGFTDDMGYRVFSSFFRRPFDFGRIRSRAKHFTVIASDDDPYVNLRYGDELAEKLGGILTVKHGFKHMSKECFELPDVVEAIRKEE